MVRKFFEHEQFNFELQFALGGVHYGAGDVGEMLSTADRVVDGDADSWCREWIATGQRLAAMAEGCARSGHRVSARAAYLRAATYFAVALSSVDGTKDPAALLRGYWVPRALAFEPRIAAAIADPGVFDVFAPWSEAIPSQLRQLLDSGDKQAFDQMKGCSQRHPRNGRTGSGAQNRTACSLPSMCSPLPADTTSPT
jgi:hypothetical protein